MELVCTKSTVPWFELGDVYTAIVNDQGNIEVFDNDDMVYAQWWNVEHKDHETLAVLLPHGLVLAEFQEVFN